jgi:hypothetical protein
MVVVLLNPILPLLTQSILIKIRDGRSPLQSMGVNLSSLSNLFYFEFIMFVTTVTIDDGDKALSIIYGKHDV